MNKTVKLLAGLIVAIAANTAIAEPGNWYIGAGAGQSNYKDWASQEDITAFMELFGASLGIANFNGSQSADSQDKALGYKLFGGYSYNKNIAVEFSYIDMGEVDANSSASGTFFDIDNNSVDGDIFAMAKAGVDAFTLDANLSFPITSFAAVMVKAGVYSADTKLELKAGSSISAENVDDSKTDNSTGLHLGIGASFRVTDAIGLRAEWERLDNVEANLEGSNTDLFWESDIDLFSASLIYSF